MLTVTSIFVLFCCVTYVSVVRAGFSEEVCDSMNPDDSVSKQGEAVLAEKSADSNPSPVKFHIDSVHYRKSSRLKVSLIGEAFGPFILQARLLGQRDKSKPTRIGKFVEPLPSGAEFLRCPFGDPAAVVTHSDNSRKQNLTFTWEAPNTAEGSFEFLLTVVQDTRYWMKVKSAGITYSPFPPDLNDCGKTASCFTYAGDSKDDCSEGKCGIIVLSDVTGDMKIASFVIGGRVSKNRGYVGLGFTKDKNVMSNMTMIGCIKNGENTDITPYLMSSIKNGFIKSSTIILMVSTTKQLDDDMIWCKFHINIRASSVGYVDLSKPLYQVYMQGDLNDANNPLLPADDKLIVSDKMLQLNQTVYVKKSSNVARITVSTISLITSLCVAFIFIK